jgi:hypothetical protein
MRSGLLTAITQACSTLTQFTISQELPFAQNGEPLYRKNMKKIYADATQLAQGPLLEVLSGDAVVENLYTTRVYFAVDAKNPPSQTTQLITNLQTAKSNTGLISFDDECDWTTEIDEDRIIYTFEYRSLVATT